MKCTCGIRLELTKYSRDLEDGRGAHRVYECPDEECEFMTQEVRRGHEPPLPRTKEQKRDNYFRHALEVSMLGT